MTDKDADDKIQRITKLLEKGGTMLATHHECGAPMFRYQGKVVCPVCDFQEKKQETKTKDISNTVQFVPQSTDLSTVYNIIMKKIQELASSLEKETDLGRVRDKMECIEQGIKILKLLRE